MSLQPTGLNLPNADALRAIGNMTSAVDASGDRVQRSNDEVICTLRKALEQSENSNKLLSDRNAQLAGRMDTLENKNKELEAVRQAEKKASEERIAALNGKVEAMIMRFTQLEGNFAGHTHNHIYCCVHSGKNCSQMLQTTTGPIIKK